MTSRLNSTRIEQPIRLIKEDHEMSFFALYPGFYAIPGGEVWHYQKVLRWADNHGWEIETGSF